MAERPETASLNRPGSGDDRARLAAQLDLARSRLTGDLSGFGDAVNITQRFQDSVRRNPGLWIGGGIAAGLLAASLLRSPGAKTSAPRHASKSLFLGLLGLAGKEILRLSGPAISRIARENVDRWMHPGPPRGR